jgi:alanyl-tRNA synthetase
VNAVDKLSSRVKELERKPKGGDAKADVEALAKAAEDRAGVRVLVKALPDTDPSALRDISDTVRQKLGDAVVMLGSATDGRVHLVANVAPSVVERGVKAADLVRAAAPIVGGGGGGRDTLAQAGGKDPEKLDEALATARAEIEKVLG